MSWSSVGPYKVRTNDHSRTATKHLRQAMNASVDSSDTRSAWTALVATNKNSTTVSLHHCWLPGSQRNGPAKSMSISWKGQECSTWAVEPSSAQDFWHRPRKVMQFLLTLFTRHFIPVPDVALPHNQLDQMTLSSQNQGVFAGLEFASVLQL